MRQKYIVLQIAQKLLYIYLFINPEIINPEKNNEIIEVKNTQNVSNEQNY